jgi:hypothetical protein
LTAGGLGLADWDLFLSFAAFQLPLGVLLDRTYAAHNATLVLDLAAGGLWFALSSSAEQPIAARALIGLGASAA